MNRLTARQRETLDFIVTCQREGWTPTFREMLDYFQMTSLNTIAGRLKALQRKGYVRATPRLSRLVEILDTGRAETIWGSFEL